MQKIDGVAWFVNWVTLAILFFGIVMVSNSVSNVTENLNTHTKDMMAASRNAELSRGEVQRRLVHLEEELRGLREELRLAPRNNALLLGGSSQ